MFSFVEPKKRLSQAALAEQANVSRPVISDLEQGRGNATLDVLERIAFALDTTVVELLTQRVREGDSDADIERRAMDGDEAFVNAHDLLEALDDRAAAVEPARFSNRGRKAAV